MPPPVILLAMGVDRTLKLAHILGIMLFRVEKVRGDSPVLVGQEWQLTTHPMLVGRESRCDLVLEHPRVSRKHARFVVRGDGVYVENLSRFGTWVNQEEVEAPRRLEDGDWIQIGGILLRAHETLEPTQSGGLMSLEALSSTQPPDSEEPLTQAVLELDASVTRARLFGHTLTLSPLAFEVLACLSASTAAWVPTLDITRAVWPDEIVEPGYAGKYVSYVRKAFAEVVDAHPELSEAVRDLIRESADAWTELEGLESSDSRALMRELIKARKKVGFRLQLAPEHIAIQGSSP